MPVVSVPALALTDKGTAPRTPEPKAPTSLAPPSSAGIRAEVHGLSHYGLPSLPVDRRCSRYLPAPARPSRGQTSGMQATALRMWGCRDATGQYAAAHVHLLKKGSDNALGHFACRHQLLSASVYAWPCIGLIFVSLRPVDFVRPFIRSVFWPTEATSSSFVA